MTHARKVVLHCPYGATLALNRLVDDFLRHGVWFVAVVGKDCSHVEDLIDELVVADGSKDRSILTSSHPNQSLEEAIVFAQSLTGEYAGGEVEVIELLPP